MSKVKEEEKDRHFDKLSIIMWLKFTTRTTNKQISKQPIYIWHVRRTCISLCIDDEYHFKIQERKKRKNLMVGKVWF